MNMFCLKNGVLQKGRTQRDFWGSSLRYEIHSSRYWKRGASRRTLSPHSRRVYQPTGAAAQGTRSSLGINSSPSVEDPSFEFVDSRPFIQFITPTFSRTEDMATICSLVQSPASSRRADAPRISKSCRGAGIALHQRASVGGSHCRWEAGVDVRGFDGCHRFTGIEFGTQKKSTGRWSAKRAALGARTLKTGQSRFFLGYKKHTFRLWISSYPRHVLLIPLVSWVTPANTSEGCLLKPSIHHCYQRWQWRPDFIVGDMGYIDAETKKLIRETWGVAVVTRLKEGMKLVPPFQTPTQATCHQGQALQWLGFEPDDQLHWFGVTANDSLCACCWHASQCPRQFSFAPCQHETLLGGLPMNTLTSQRLLQQVRPWIEPAQSYEKNQLGLNQIFFNSLRLTWIMSLLADAAVLLRAKAVIGNPTLHLPMFELTPKQMAFDFESKNEK